ncbi:MAG: DUF167 domain-containing protein [Syntrophorhabdales bacterium]
MKVDVKVITGAGKREMRLEGGCLTVKLTARPVKGRANEELIDYVAETLGLKRREVVIVAGAKSRRKVVSIPLPEEEVSRILRNSRPDLSA